MFNCDLRCEPPYTGVSQPKSCEIPKEPQKGLPGPSRPKCQKSVEKSPNLRIGNGVGKQGYAGTAIGPPIDDRNPIRKFSIDCLDASSLNQRVHSASSDSLLQRIKKKSPYGISVSTPHRRCGHRFADPIFADPVSETPTKGPEIKKASRMSILGDNIQGPPWGQQKRRKPPLRHLLDYVLSGLRWPKLA